jgi:predicted DNA binding protein
MSVLHRCDNRSCVNPDHLFVGTQADNVRDMDTKGRRRVFSHPGERCHLSKLTDDQVRAMRLESAVGRRGTQARIARELGISPAAVSDIILRRVWKHLP